MHSSYIVSLKRLFRSPILYVGIIALLLRFGFVLADERSVVNAYLIKDGWTTQFFNSMTSEVYDYYLPVIFAVIVAADYDNDRKNRFKGIIKSSNATKLVFTGKILAYITLGMAISFVSLYTLFATYCVKSGLVFESGWNVVSVALRLMVHYISFSGAMIPFYTSFAVLFAVLFKNAIGGILVSIGYVLLKIYVNISFFIDLSNITAIAFYSFTPFARYLYPYHGAPMAIVTYLYGQDHPEASPVAVEHFIAAFLCVTLCAVLMFIASYHLEKRFD